MSTPDEEFGDAEAAVISALLDWHDDALAVDGSVRNYNNPALVHLWDVTHKYKDLVGASSDHDESTPSSVPPAADAASDEEVSVGASTERGDSAASAKFKVGDRVRINKNLPAWSGTEGVLKARYGAASNLVGARWDWEFVPDSRDCLLTVFEREIERIDDSWSKLEDSKASSFNAGDIVRTADRLREVIDVGSNHVVLGKDGDSFSRVEVRTFAEVEFVK